MKLIKAIIRPEKLNDVLKALFREEVHGLTVSRVHGHGGERDLRLGPFRLDLGPVEERQAFPPLPQRLHGPQRGAPVEPQRAEGVGLG